jgi:membrane protease YdiL (CAAX protease family)
MVLPLLFGGLLLTVALTAIRDRISPGAPLPSHPVQEAISGADAIMIAQVMILGVIVAPICEEIMFRGVLYRNMREASNRFGLVITMTVSAVVTSFIFSAIHPQGWVTIPVLMALAMGFCLAREWRGSLLASMIAHGITNFVTLTLNVVLFASG